MKKKLLVLLLFAGSTLFAAGPRAYVGFGFGAPQPVAVYAPPCPGPGYTWVDGYWYGAGPHRYWHIGWWRPPYRAYGYGFGFSGGDHSRHYARDDRGRGRTLSACRVRTPADTLPRFAEQASRRVATH
jgi:hypothetical protein